MTIDILIVTHRLECLKKCITSITALETATRIVVIVDGKNEGILHFSKEEDIAL